jgi:hypothetical protein
MPAWLHSVHNARWPQSTPPSQCSYFVKQFEQKDPEEQICLVAREVFPIDDISDEVLAYSIRCAIRVREFEASKYRIVCQMAGGAVQPAIKNTPPFCCEAPISIENGRDVKFGPAYRDRFALRAILGRLPKAKFKGKI